MSLDRILLCNTYNFSPYVFLQIKVNLFFALEIVISFSFWGALFYSSLTVVFEIGGVWPPVGIETINPKLVLTTSLFCLGLFGIVPNRTNLLLILICIDLVLFSIDINFLIFSVYLDDLTGQVFALFVLTVVSSESDIGLAIVVIYYHLQNNIILHPTGLLYCY